MSARGCDAYSPIRKPSGDELQVTVFGSRTGESVVAHLGHDRWIVVDSFMDGAVPVAQRWLEKLEVPRTSVRAIFLTHFHADHFRGIRELADSYTDAMIYIPGVLAAADWRNLFASAARARTNKLNDSELRKASAILLDIPDERIGLLGRNQILPIIGDAVRTVGPAPTFGRLTGLGILEHPSAALDLSSDAINLTSTVLFVRVGAANALLGADMNAHADHGWPAILRELGDLQEPLNIGLLKVPHHGSKHAHDAGLIGRLAAESTAIITPNVNGRLPDEEMLVRFRDAKVESHKVYITSLPRRNRSPDPAIATKVDSPIGRVTATARIDTGVWSVDCSSVAQDATATIRAEV